MCVHGPGGKVQLQPGWMAEGSTKAAVWCNPSLPSDCSVSGCGPAEHVLSAGTGSHKKNKYKNFQWALFCQSWSSPTALRCGHRFPAAVDERQGAIAVHLSRFSSRDHRAKAWLKWLFLGQDFWWLWSVLMWKNKPFRRKNITSYHSAIKIHKDF